MTNTKTKNEAIKLEGIAARVGDMSDASLAYCARDAYECAQLADTHDEMRANAYRDEMSIYLMEMRRRAVR